LLLLQQGGTGDAAGWRWLLFGASAIPPHQREGFQLDINAWVVKLNQWGFKDALQHPNTTVAFYVTFSILRWVAIVLVIAVAAVGWLMISVIASVLKGR
jgi:hypothetical protein